MRVIHTLLAVRPGQDMAVRDRKSGVIFLRGRPEDPEIRAFTDGTTAQTVRRGFEFLMDLGEEI